MVSDGLDPELLTPLRTALEQVHEQVLAQGTLPLPGLAAAPSPGVGAARLTGSRSAWPTHRTTSP